MFLNHDGRWDTLTINARKGETGVGVTLREQYATDRLAQTIATMTAKRLGMRRRGSGWMKVLR